MSHQKQRPRAIAFLYENSMFLIVGAVAALIWANVAPDSYHHFIHLDLTGGDNHHAAPVHDDTEDGESRNASEGTVAATEDLSLIHI